MIDRGAEAISNAVESAGDRDAARKGHPPKPEGTASRGLGDREIRGSLSRLQVVERYL